jgi:N-acetylmuramoyl-L-alanine amidase
LRASQRLAVNESVGNLTRSFRRYAPRSRYVVLAAVAGLFFLIWPARALRSDNFIFYLPGTHQVVPLRELGRAQYLSLLRVLNTVGMVSGLQESSNSLTVYYGSTTLKFRTGKKKVEIDKKGINLSDPVRMEEGQWLVPLDFLSKVLPRIVKSPVEYQAGSRRAFVGAVHPATFALHLTRLPEGARLTVDFTAPIKMRTASQNGKWYVYLGSQPIQPLESGIHFQNPYVASAQFDDQDGEPKLIITPRVEGLDFYPTLADHDRTIRADLLKSQPAVAQTPPAAPPPTQAATSPAPPAPAAPGQQPSPAFPGPAPVSNLPVVALDAGHGGNNLGARGANGLVEKNLVAQLAMRARSALLATGRYRVVLTRLGDTDPGFDQRDAIANATRPLAFISFHAGNLGFRTPQVAIYTYLPSLPVSPAGAPADAPGTAPGTSLPPLLRPWATLQVSHLAASQTLAQVLRDQLSKVPGVAAVQLSRAPVRVLRSVDAPAAALEVGSLSPDADPVQLLNAQFQESLANAVVTAVEAFRPGGAQP